ncbi:MAG: hypothetical protein KF893_12250, partial [Caldilineaceae bacterium]|nr:hypothetical protein [Caldilineaceae bacterium]
MEKECITLELPMHLAQKLHSLAAEEQADPVEVVTRLIDIEFQRRNWQRDLNTLPSGFTPVNLSTFKP